MKPCSLLLSPTSMSLLLPRVSFRSHPPSWQLPMMSPPLQYQCRAFSLSFSACLLSRMDACTATTIKHSLSFLSGLKTRTHTIPRVQHRSYTTRNTVAFAERGVGAASTSRGLGRLTRSKGDELVRLFKCSHPGCDKAYSKSHHLRRHEMIHTGIKPHKCDFEGCSKAFMHQEDLRRHKRIHTGEKPYKCEFEGCSKAFSSASGFAQHQKVHTGERPFACDRPGCDKAFSTGQNLRAHKLSHTGVKHFKCDYRGCDKSFTLKGNLKVHRRIHTGEMPYKCDFDGCGEVFRYHGAYKKHKQLHL